MKKNPAFFFLLLSLSFSAHAAPDRINGGEFVADVDPVAAMTVNLYSGGESFCTGVLYARDVVITAAHCLAEQRSAFGAELFGASPERRARVRAKSFRVHPEFEYRNELFQLGLSDIAVVLLAGPVPTHATPAAIAAAAGLREGDVVVSAGYGRGSQGRLKKVSLRVVAESFAFQEFLVHQNLAAGICYGDSGGPAFTTRGGRLEVIGIASRFWNERSCAGDLVLTSVPFFRKWIEDTILELRAL